MFNREPMLAVQIAVSILISASMLLIFLGAMMLSDLQPEPAKGIIPVKPFVVMLEELNPQCIWEGETDENYRP